MIGVTIDGAAEARVEIEAIGNRIRNVRDPLLALGNWMVTSSVPRNFQAGGRPTRWATASRWGLPTADPLRDTGHLMRSVGYEVAGQMLTIGAGNGGELPYAPLQQWGSVGLPGGVVRPKKKFLAIPIVGPGALTVTQARTMGPKEFGGAFVLMQGPEGPGVYVKGTKHGQRLARGKRGGFVSGREKTVVRIFAFARQVKVPARPFLIFHDEDTALFLAFVRAYFAGDPNWRSARP